MQKQIDDIKWELGDTNQGTVANTKNIKELAHIIGLIRSYINFKLNDGVNSNNETELEQWEIHLHRTNERGRPVLPLQDDIAADAYIYGLHGGRGKRRTRKRRLKKSTKRRRRKKKTKRRRKRRR